MAKSPEKPDEREFRFNLGDAYQHDRFPMKRLSEYLREIIGLFGEDEQVYFIGLEEGSTVAVVRAEPEQTPILVDGLQAVLRGDGPQDRIAAYSRFKDLLQEDAEAYDAKTPDESNIIQFPGSWEPVESLVPDFGWIEEYESLDGIPIEVSGDVDKDKKKIRLKSRDGRIVHTLYADKSLANEIKLHMWDETVRVEGKAQWKADQQGKWMMKNFIASGFSVLKEISLNEDIAALRAYPAKWKELEDPLRDLDIIRHEDDIQ